MKENTMMTVELTSSELELVEKRRQAAEKKMKRNVLTEKYPVLKIQKDNNALHLYVRGIRVLTASEFEALRAAIPQERHRILLDILIVTGMRYIEVQRFHKHPEWYNEKKNIIHLPEQAALKVKKTQLERTIHPLPSLFHYILKPYWNSNKPPGETTWNKNFQRWAVSAGMNPYGLSAKTTRKTIESWMIAAGITESTVCLRQGHDSVTSMKHYQGLAFSDDELRDIKKKLIEWGLIR